MQYEEYARRCLWLSLGADAELRDMLLRLARIWIRASVRRAASRRRSGSQEPKTRAAIIGDGQFPHTPR
jgi:hypothetical protein